VRFVGRALLKFSPDDGSKAQEFYNLKKSKQERKVQRQSRAFEKEARNRAMMR